MRLVNIKICKYCKRAFCPSKYSPGQSCCSNAVCRRARDAERQKLYYRKKIKDPDWKKQLSKRKKEERFQRSERVACDKPSPASTEQVISANLPQYYDSLIFGILSSISGSRTYEDLVKFREHCIKFGMEVYPSSVTGYPNRPGGTAKRFPHASFEENLTPASRLSH